ncbi:MAG TPA: hypothetical protein VN612_10870 [Acidobacteriaceae bacterium]|nr:hypothetical protein [Acidobacteriaceae bacterium]
MSGHTPGPWSLRISSKGYENKFQIQREDGTCLFSFGDSPFHDDAEADARLIAAAPILLQELRGANTQMEIAAECIEAGRYDEALLHVCSMSRKRRAAIAAATGETP